MDENKMIELVKNKNYYKLFLASADYEFNKIEDTPKEIVIKEIETTLETANKDLKKIAKILREVADKLDDVINEDVPNNIGLVYPMLIDNEGLWMDTNYRIFSCCKRLEDIYNMLINNYDKL